MDKQKQQSGVTRGEKASSGSGEAAAQLTDLQKYVIRDGGTERPFDNEYWDNEEAGIYVDLLTGAPLFSSRDKFDSGTGWPSFTRPLAIENVTTRTDRKLFMERTEVRSAGGDCHLGHVFPDGPREAGGLRYCINSAALRFIPQDRMAEEGYAEYLSIFNHDDGTKHGQ
ncbi:MAG: peptide-methionine (R)-S-oxide reductase MsrB [Micavibrio sp.]